MKGLLKRGKKWMLFVLSAALVCTTLCVPAAYAATAAVDEDFNSYADRDAMNNNGGFSTENSGNISIVAQKSISDKSVLFQNSGSNGNLKKSFTPIDSGYVVISTDFMKNTLGGGMRLQQVWSGENSSGSRPYLLKLADDGKIVINTGTDKTVGIVAANVWYQVTTIADLTNKGLYIFIDGQQMNTEIIPFWNDVSTISSINIQSETSNKVYVDNLYVDHFQNMEAALAAVKLHALYTGTEDGAAMGKEERSALKAAAEQQMSILRDTNDDTATAALKKLADDAIPELGTVLYAEDFESYEENAAFGGEYVARNNASVVTVGDSKRAKLIYSDGKARLLKELNTGVKGGVELSFQFMQEEKAAIASIARTVDSTYNKVTYTISSNGTDFIITGTGGVAHTLVENYQAGVWYDFKVNLDYANQCTSAFVYQGDTLVGSIKGLLFLNNLIVDGSSIKRIFDSSTETAGCSYYLDNIKAVNCNVPVYEDALVTLTYKDAAGADALTMTDGGSVAQVYYKCNQPAAKMIAALYNADGTLESTTFFDVADTDSAIAKKELNLALPQTVAGTELKIFLWNGGETMVLPLSENIAQQPEAEAKPTLFLAGDSTVATYADTYYPQAGWGAMIDRYVTDDIVVDNRSIPGYSFKRFLEDGYYDALLQDSRPGDTVLIQFAHNDQKFTEANSYARTYLEYKAYIALYVAMAKERGVTPILVTSPVRRICDNFTGDTRLVSNADAMKAAAAVLDVPVIDLFTKTKDLILDCYGYDSEDAKALYLYLEASDYRYLDDPEFENSTYNKDAVTDDKTHFCRYGAEVLAKLVATELKTLPGWDSIVTNLDNVPVAPASNE